MQVFSPWIAKMKKILSSPIVHVGIFKIQENERLTNLNSAIFVFKSRSSEQKHNK